MKSILLLLAVAFSLSSPGWAQEGPGEKKLVFVVKEASIESVLLYVSRVTGWIFIQEAPLRGTITAISNADVPASSCLEFLNTALRPHGLGVINPYWPRLPKPGEVLRIVDLAKVAALTPAVHVGLEPRDIPIIEDARTQVLPLKSAGAAEVAKELSEVFRKAMGEGGQVAISTTSNAIVLTGRSEGIRRVAEILRAIDETAAVQLKTVVFPLDYAEATEVAKTLNDVCRRDPPRGDPNSAVALPNLLRRMLPSGEGDRAARSPAHEVVRITAEPKTNALIVTATDDNLAALERLIRAIDLPSAGLMTYVVRLKNNDASAVAAILNALYGMPGKTAAAPAAPRARSDGTPAPGQSGANIPSLTTGSRGPTPVLPRRGGP